MIESTLRLEWRTPAELAENPKNWRRHPKQQIDALSDVLGEVGWAGACLFNERTGRLIDGHARRKVALEQGAEKMPVLVGDWSEADEAKILATLDPLAAMAEADAAAFGALMQEIQTESDAIKAMLDAMAAENPVPQDEPPPTPQTIDAIYQILITFPDESSQGEWLAKLTEMGLECRSLIV